MTLESFPIILEQLILVILLQLAASGELLEDVVEDALLDLLVLQHVLDRHLVLVLRGHVLGQDSEHVGRRLLLATRKLSLVEAPFVSIARGVNRYATLESVIWSSLLEAARRLYGCLSVIVREWRIIGQVGHVESAMTRRSVVVHERHIKLGTSELKVSVLHAWFLFIVIYTSSGYLGIDRSKALRPGFGQFRDRMRLLGQLQVVVHSCTRLFEFHLTLHALHLIFDCLLIVLWIIHPSSILQNCVLSAHRKEGLLLHAYPTIQKILHRWLPLFLFLLGQF